MKLSRNFFAKNTVWVAKKLLGKILVRRLDNGKMIRGKIMETEAYCGPKDLASHASRGKTKRTEIMFGKAGLAYVYLIYGMYYCLNIVTEKKDYPAAVLIRAVLPFCHPERAKRVEGSNPADGPGKLCRYFQITKSLNGEDLTRSDKLWIEEGEEIKARDIVAGKRIGVGYAGKWKEKLWRFYIR